MIQQPEKDWKTRAKRYLVYAIIAIVCAIVLYIFVWFGSQLGLQN